LRAGLSNPNIAAIAADDRSLWLGFGYQGGYIDRLDARGVQYERNYATRDSIYDSHIQALAVRGNRLYYGGYRGFGYLAMDGSGDRRFFGAGSALPFADIADIAWRDTAELYLAGLFGVIRFDPERDSFEVLEGAGAARATCVLPLGDSLWYGTLANGLFVRDLHAGTDTCLGLGRVGRIVAVALLHEGDEALLVVTKPGPCYRVERGSLRLERLEMPSGILDKRYGPFEREIMTAQVIDGRMWLGTREAGCSIFDGRRRWVSMTYHDGLASNEVRAIAGSADYVWIGSYGGVSRFDKLYIEGQFFPPVPSAGEYPADGPEGGRMEPGATKG
jgi:ligand-binding sensor domain-containing protein